jgi:hypothetical protein
MRVATELSGFTYINCSRFIFEITLSSNSVNLVHSKTNLPWLKAIHDLLLEESRITNCIKL